MATIEQRTEGTWQARIRKNGHPPTVKTFINKNDAEAWARKTESEMERGLWRDTTEAETTSLSTALARYKVEVSAHKRSARTESTTIRAWLDTSVADISLARIGGSDIAKIRDAWLLVYSPATVTIRLALLSHLFVTAAREWGMPSLLNPVANIKKPKISNARTRRVSEAELLAVCAGTESATLPSIVRLAVETAMRREEITKLRWKNIDLQQRTALLLDTKNGEDRTVPLSSVAVTILSGLPRNISGRVFSITPDALTRAFTRAVDRARSRYVADCEKHGLEPESGFLTDLHLHDLRHEATSRLADIFQAHELAKITGHKDLKMVMRYYHPRAEDLAKRLA